MKALSICQPWAWLIVTGHKDVENRTWHTKFRGQIAVHASQKFDNKGYEWVRKHFPQIGMPEPHGFERGGIVGKVTITGCVDEMDSHWFTGPYGFTLSGGEPLPFVPCKGQLKFFEIGERVHGLVAN